MKTTLKLISVFLTAALLISCADTLTDIQTKSFIKFFGSYQVDIGKDVHVTADGGYAITGCMVPDSVIKMVLIQANEYGNQTINSPSYYGGAYKTEGESMVVLADGFLLGGQITDTLPDMSLHTDIYLVRTNTIGEEVWSARYGGDGNESLSHVIERSSGGFILAGKKEVNGQDDIWIIMVDESGNVIYELTGNNAVDDDEANFIHNTGAGYLCACTYNDGAFDGTDILSLYIDEYCNIINSRSIGTDFEDQARSIIPFNGSYLMMGYARNTSIGFNQIQLYTFSLEGNQIKNMGEFATFSESDADIPIGTDLIAEACVVNSNGELTIVGTSEVNEDRDMLLLLVDEDGNLIPNEDPDIEHSLRSFGDEGAQKGYSVKRSLDGGLIFAGSNSLEGNSVISLVKTNSRGEL